MIKTSTMQLSGRMFSYKYDDEFARYEDVVMAIAAEHDKWEKEGRWPQGGECTYPNRPSSRAYKTITFSFGNLLKDYANEQNSKSST